jgi:hypothetical protein
VRRRAVALLVWIVLAVAFAGHSPADPVTPRDGRWVEIATPGPIPSPRSFAVTGFDAERERFYLYGGAGSKLNEDDLWMLSLRERTGRWEQLPISGTGPGSLFILGASTFDSRHMRFVVCMWPTDSTTRIYVLSLSGAPVWSSTDVAGSAPANRSEGVFVYDSEQDRSVLFGGSTAHGTTNDVWALSLDDSPKWTRIEPTGLAPEGRWGAAGTYDPVRGRLVICGGQNNSKPQPYVLGDVWALPLNELGSWSRLASLPLSVFALGAVYDPLADRALTFGGSTETGYFSDATWSLSLLGRGEWEELATPLPRPPGRAYPALALDQSRDRLLAFGGLHSGPSNDTWVLDLPRARTGIRAMPGASDPVPSLIVTSLGPERGALLNWQTQLNDARLDVFDLRGARVWGYELNGPASSIQWNGRDAAGHALPRGVYFVRLRSGATECTARIALIR